MVIGVDGNEANLRERVGVNVYAYEILRSLYKLQDLWGKKLRFIIYLSKNPIPEMPKEVKNLWEYKVIGGGKFWVLTKLMPRLLRNPERVDLLFTPSHYTVPFSFVPRVCSIMDLGYLKFSGQFKKSVYWQLKYWSAISILVSKRILAISKATAKDIVRHYPIASKKVVVTELGLDPSKFRYKADGNDVRRIKNEYGIVDDYILFLSTLKPSKNIEGLLKAFGRIKNEFPGYQLVIAGKKGWMFETIFNEVKRLGLEGKVVFTGFLPEEEKPILMAGAKVFVCPSFWEGFGLIALEAMAVGTPVVVSNTASFPEIVDNAGRLVNPGSAQSISEGIKAVLNMPEKQYNDLVARGLAQARKFSWELSAKKTLKALEEVI
jgi:glycosyltransferase involved in cell wall biosynthesis